MKKQNYKNLAKKYNSQIKTWEKKSVIVSKAIHDKLVFFGADTSQGNLSYKNPYAFNKFMQWYNNNIGSYSEKMKDLQFKEGIDNISDALNFLEMKYEYSNKLNEMYGRSSEATAILHRHIKDESMSMTEARDFLEKWEKKINSKSGRAQLGKWQLEQMQQ